MDEHIADLEKRVAALEAQIQELPKKTIATIIAELNQKVSSIPEELQPQSARLP